MERATTTAALAAALAVTVATVVAGAYALDCGLGDEAVGYSPATSFTIAVDDDRILVTHDGGDTLPRDRTDALRIRVGAAEADATTTYRWGALGGYPVRPGDSVVVPDPTVAGRPPADGDVIRVIWEGTWAGRTGCDLERETTAVTATLAKRTVGEQPGGTEGRALGPAVRNWTASPSPTTADAD